MNKKFLGLLGISLLTLTGCATTGASKNYEADINSLNTKVATLQGQLQAKDEEITRLQSQLTDSQSSKAEAENERRALAQKLEDANNILNAERNKVLAQASSKKNSYDSDLK